MGFLDTSARIRRAVITDLDLLPAENYYTSIAKALPEVNVGDAFCSDETGEMRRYERIQAVPGYSDLGEKAAPATRKSVDDKLVGELLLNQRGMTWAQAQVSDLSRSQTIMISDRANCTFVRWSPPMANLDPYQMGFSWLTSGDGSQFFLPHNNVTPFEAFGAKGDYDYDTRKGTDNTAPLQAAFNWARPYGGSLTARAGGKYLTGALYLHFDAVKNPGAVPEPADTSKSDGSWRPGRLSLIGQGGGIATGSLETPGCALIHKPGETDPLLSCIGSFSIAKPSAMGGQLSILRLNLVGGNTSPAVLYLEAVQGQVSIWDLTVKGTNKNGHGVVCKTTWEKWVCNVLVRGPAAGLGPNDPGYNPYAALATGIGWLETDNGSGGQVNMSTWTNVNVYRWGTLWFIGRTNGSDGTFGPLVFIGCQGSYADYHGVVLGGGVLDLETFGFQIEQTRLNGLLIDSQGASDIPRSINWRGYFTQCGKIEDGSPQSFATHVVDGENVTLHKNTYRAVRGGVIFDRSKVKNLAIVRPYCRDVSAWGKANGTFIDAYGDLTNFACISLERPRLVNGTKTIVGPLAQEAFDREAVGEVKTDSTESTTPSLSMGFATGNASTKLLVLNKPTKTLITDFIDAKAFQPLQLPFTNPNSEVASNGNIYLAGESFVPADNRATLSLRRDPSNTYWAEVAGARYVGEERVLSMSAVPVVLTGSTAKKTFAGFGLRGGYLGIDGRVELDLIFSCTNNANVKTLRVEYGGTTFFAAALTTVASGRAQPAFQNRGNAKSQLSASGSNLGVGTNTSEVLTMSIDSSVFQQILITGQLANAADTLTLEGYRIRGVRGRSASNP